ncbi:GntR family transcriptional regulator [Sphingobacterium sp. SGG-5]|uniref:GntR family transcriptional regulator n=1 Tax=Sphingobacterium sp. SGG-5 TaxID=2710881 RepID=UPI001F0F08CC|nr:GntR family transcriptional regulator [Sphingobacterium sp. SGG-5]
MKETPESTAPTGGMTQRLKYMQLVDFIISQIENDKLGINDRLPTLNQLTSQLKISKETALKGLTYLSEKGIIESEYRKGYYVKRLRQLQSYRVCLIFDKMNVLRDTVYQAFLETIKDHAEVEVFFHHHNFKVFEKLIEENLNNYTHFVVVTFFKENPSAILNKIPSHKRIVIDHREPGLHGDYTCIYQDHKSDIIESLTELLPRLDKYQRLVLLAPLEAFHAQDLIEGFTTFAKQYEKPHKVLHTINEASAKKGDAYITFSRYDQDDVDIIKIARKKKWKLGKDIGLLSYNDTAVKEVLEDGITVISTDFYKMGQEAARAILNRTPVMLRDPAKVIIRNSL